MVEFIARGCCLQIHDEQGMETHPIVGPKAAEALAEALTKLWHSRPVPPADWEAEFDGIFDNATAKQVKDFIRSIVRPTPPGKRLFEFVALTLDGEPVPGVDTRDGTSKPLTIFRRNMADELWQQWCSAADLTDFRYIDEPPEPAVVVTEEQRKVVCEIFIAAGLTYTGDAIEAGALALAQHEAKAVG